LFGYLFAGYTLISLATFLLPQLLQWVFKPQNLKTKYNATWALVTGGSSGIGLSIVNKLAQQGINVFVVARDDDVLRASVANLRQSYPSIVFESLGLDLSDVKVSIAQIAERTKGTPISLLFNNAGYLNMCLFSDQNLKAIMDNFNANLTIAIELSHLFASRMVKDPNITKGAITFTSSPAAMMPNPFATMYGCTKAGLTAFATSLAPELILDNIDVLVVHPSPVNTAFYTEEATKLSATLAMFRKTATTPDSIADCFFSYLGRTVIYDQGYFPLALRFLYKLLDYNLFVFLTTRFSFLSAEAKNLRAKRT